jgi:hypothetical protein
MLLTVSVLVPVLLIVSVAVAVAFIATFPNARFPDTPMIFVGAAVPVPDAVIVLVPLVWSELTVTVPL